MNVVLVVLDTVRARETVPADPDLAPTLAALADAGTEYQRAYTAAPWTLPAHASLFTGTYPSKHDTHGDNPALDRDLATLPALFADAGYGTLGVSNNTWVSDEFGFDRGFDTFGQVFGEPADAGRAARDEEAPDPVDDAHGARTTTDLAVDWLRDRERDREPFFAFLNYIDAHFPYAPPERYVADRLPPGYDRDRAIGLLEDARAYDAGATTLTDRDLAALRALYAGEIARLDDVLGRLVAELRALDEWEDTLFVVTSDHGENIGDHGFVGHQYTLRDSLLHVPLVVAGGAARGWRDGDQFVQITDLAPSLLDAAGVDAPAAREQFQGRSIHGSATVSPRTTVVSEYHSPRPSVATLRERFGEVPPHLDDLPSALPLRSVRTDEYRLVRGADGPRALYDVTAAGDRGRAGGDASTGENSLADRPEAASRLGDELDRWLDSFAQRVSRPGGSISSESERRLRDLGYL